MAVAPVIAPETAVPDLLQLLERGDVFFRGIRNDPCFHLFRAALPTRLQEIATGVLASVVVDSNTAKDRRGLQRLNPLLRLAIVNTTGSTLLPACAHDLAEVAPHVVAFPASHPYEGDHLHFYCESVASLHAFLTTMEERGNRRAFEQSTRELKAKPRKELVNLYGQSITRVASIAVFPTAHVLDQSDYGIVFSLTNIAGRTRQRLNKAVLKNCADHLAGKEKEPGVLYQIPPANGERGNYRKRKHDGTSAQRPPKRPRRDDATTPLVDLSIITLDDLLAGFEASSEGTAATTEASPEGVASAAEAFPENRMDMVCHGELDQTRRAASTEASPEGVALATGAFPEDTVGVVPRVELDLAQRIASLEAVVDSWEKEEAFYMPDPRVRGHATDARALAAVLVQCLRDAGAAALLKGAGSDTSDWSDYSDSDDEDDSEEYVLRSREPNVLALHLRKAETKDAWRDANERVIKFDSLLTDVCATVRNPSRTRTMEAHMLMMDKRGYMRLQLVRKGPAVLAPGATLTMKNDDSSFIISAPEDDQPVEGFFLLFYQWCTPDKHQPKWFVASRGYHLLPEEAGK